MSAVNIDTAGADNDVYTCRADDDIYTARAADNNNDFIGGAEAVSVDTKRP